MRIANAELADPDPTSSEGFDLSSVVREGTVAGAAAAAAVAVLHGIADLIAGDLLATPRALHAALFPAAASPAAAALLVYSTIHLAAWIVAGIATAWLVSLADARPSVWLLAFAALVAGFASLLYLSGALAFPEGTQAEPALPLWAGSAAGAVVVTALLALRHPGVLRQRARTEVTEGEKSDLLRALRFECQARAELRAAARSSGRHPLLEALHGERDQRVELLLQQLERCDLPVPEDVWQERAEEPQDLEWAVERALTREREAAALYEELAATALDLRLRGVYVRLGASARSHGQRGGAAPAELS